ncbi:hypothetical protein AAFN60_01990 [Roseibacillus persicicus]|uniref:hypothetical protein n=1 Tax=Roseibacillus persicicus TaxID=454148 RepID=UPI00398A7F2A
MKSLIQSLHTPLVTPLAYPLGQQPTQEDFHPLHAPLSGWWSTRYMLNASDEATDYRDGVKTIRDVIAGADATQATAGDRPEALPVEGGEGYLHLPGAAGNYAVSLFSEAWEEFAISFIAGAVVDGTASKGVVLGVTGGDAGYVGVQLGSATSYFSDETVNVRTSAGTAFKVTAESFNLGDVVEFRAVANSTEWAVTSSDLIIDYERTGALTMLQGTGVLIGRSADGAAFPAAVKFVRITGDAGGEFEVDFRAATHLSASLGTVTVNASGTNPAAIIAQPVARFESSDDLVATTASDFGGHTLLSVYKDLTTGDRFVRESTVTASDIASTSGTALTLGGVAMFFEDAITLPSGTDSAVVAQVAAWLSRQRGAALES